MRIANAQLPLLCTTLCLALAVVGCSGASESGASSSGPPRSAITGALPAKGDLLFVLRGQARVAEGEGLGSEERRRAEGGQADASVSKREPEADARLRGVHDRIEVKADAVEWFTDRPQRKAGIAPAHELVDRWKGYGFDEQPPNASVVGPGTDAVVELRAAHKTSDGVAFEAVGIRGELPPKRDAELSLFIDSSEWETDMHVYPYGSFCPENETSTLTNPQVITAPQSWSYPPQESLNIPWAENDADELFNAASKSGTTSFEVEYSAECNGQDVGSVTFKGKVPDSLSSNTWDCSENISGATCQAVDGSGYHARALAQFIPDWESESGMR